MINELPTVYEVVTCKPEQPKNATRSNGNKSKSNGSVVYFTFINSLMKFLLSFVILLFIFHDTFVLPTPVSNI